MLVQAKGVVYRGLVVGLVRVGCPVVGLVVFPGPVVGRGVAVRRGLEVG